MQRRRRAVSVGEGQDLPADAVRSDHPAARVDEDRADANPVEQLGVGVALDHEVVEALSQGAGLAQVR